MYATCEPLGLSALKLIAFVGQRKPWFGHILHLHTLDISTEVDESKVGWQPGGLSLNEPLPSQKLGCHSKKVLFLCF